jgi:hypothetical protein
MTGEGTVNRKGLVCAVVICKVWKLAIVLQLIIVMICKWSLNAISNPNPSIITHTRDSLVYWECG